MRRVLIIGYLTVYLAVSFVDAQRVVQNQYRFKHITVDQGLSNNLINSICQDSKGFIWIGTGNGLNKYDGLNIVTYVHDPQDSSTISSNQIEFIFQDSKKKLWIATNTGLDFYNRDFNNFTRFSHEDTDWNLGHVHAIAEDKNGKLWFGAESGLYAYDLNSLEIQFFSNNEDNPHGLPNNPIYKLLTDRNNNIWISIRGSGLCVYNQSDGTFKYFKNDPDDPSTISDNIIELLYEDNDGNIWAGTMNNGLNRYIPENNTFERTIPDKNNSYSNRVRAIFEDMKGNFFIGTRGGIYIRDEITNEFELYANEGHNFSELSQNSITRSYIDKTGTLWIGTFSGGINYTNLNKKEFIHYEPGKDDDHFLNGSNIYAITEDAKGNLWIGGDNGLNYLDRTTSRFTYFVNNPDDPNSLSYNDVKALEWDNEGNLWIGTNNGGLNYYDVKTGEFKTYRHDPDNPNSLAHDKVYGLISDKDDNLWIITNIIGVNTHKSIDFLPKNTDTFIHLNKEVYYGFDQDENGNIYIGGINGFWIFTKKDSVFKFISNENLIGNVNMVRKDSKGIIWIGSIKGLVRYNQEDNSFIRFSSDNGYPINEVFGILEDDTQNLWVSTNFGLIKITNIVNDTSNINFRVFDSDDGLQSKQFTYNAYYKCKSGELAFGGINGFNIFYPDKITENPEPPNVVLTDLKIFNTSTPIGENVGGRIILTKSISVTEEIKLGRKQNVFTLEFAALHYANPEKNMFRFKLEGFDSDWQTRKASNNFATYSNLPAKEYTFLVTAANNDGIWNPKPVELIIIVKPPFWKTMWFYSLVFVVLAFVIMMFIRMREKKIKSDKARLENELHQGKEEIEKQKDEIRKQQEALRINEEAEADSKWHNTGIAKFSDLISNNRDDVKKLTQEVLNNLISYVGAHQGAIFLVNDDKLNEDEKVLELIASYAYSKEKIKKVKIINGEGLVGTCYKDREIKRIDNLPQDYLLISSGLGEVSPKYLLLAPIQLTEYIIGVLELTSFHPFDDHKIEFIEKITENLTSVVSITRSKEQALQSVLLANEQKEELLAQEEEMRQNLEEMKATQEELLRKQDALSLENAIVETLLNFLQDRITIKDTNGVYIRINKVKSDALKLKDPSDAIGLTDADFFGEAHFNKALNEEKKLIKTGKPHLNIEEQIKFNDGRIQWGSTSRIPFRNHNNEMIGTLIITKDISDQKIIRGNFNSQSTLLRELTSIYPLILYEVNHTGLINQIYGHGLELLGLKTENIKEKDIFSVFKELIDKLDIKSLKDDLNVEYDYKNKKKSYRVIHRIIKNSATGGIMGCAEVKVFL